MFNIGFNAVEFNTDPSVITRVVLVNASVEQTSSVVAEVVRVRNAAIQVDQNYEVLADLFKVCNVDATIEQTTVVSATDSTQVLLKSTVEYSALLQTSVAVSSALSTTIGYSTQVNADLVYGSANIWDTKQGVAKGYAKFTPMLDAEPFVEEQSSEFSFTTVKPITEAIAPFVSEKGNASVATVFSIKANGYAPVNANPAATFYQPIQPMASGHSAVFMFRVDNRFSLVTPKSSAQPIVIESSAVSEVGYTFPWGVKNPTDEELLVVIMQARRQRHLTTPNRNGIRH